MSEDLANLEIDRFEGRQGEVFRALADDGSPLELRLHEVASLGERDPGARRVRRHPFSLLFRGPREPMLSQSLRRLEHPEMGHLDLFLVPIDQDGEKALYEAVFT